VLADLELLLAALFCTADDLLPERAKNARRSATDAEVVTLVVGQQVMGIDTDGASSSPSAQSVCRTRHLFPKLPGQSGYWKRRRRLTENIESLTGVFAQDCPGHRDHWLRLDSTPVECGRSVETARRSQLADACGYGYSRSHSRWFWGMRLHLSSPRSMAREERRSWIRQTRKNATSRYGCCGSGCTAARPSSPTRATPGQTSKRQSRSASGPKSSARCESGRGPHLAPMRQCIESLCWMLKDRLGHHNARSLHGLRARMTAKLLALAAGVWLNHHLGRPSRKFADLAAQTRGINHLVGLEKRSDSKPHAPRHAGGGSRQRFAFNVVSRAASGSAGG
jgi:hypothetical protein